MMISNLDSDFIARTLRTSTIVSMVLFPFGLYYMGLYSTLAILSGFVWSILNLVFLSSLIRSAIRPEGADTGRSIAMALIKFPLLYASGFFLLKVDQFQPTHLLIGFSIPMAIMVLKVLGRLFLGLDNTANKPENLQKAL